MTYSRRHHFSSIKQQADQRKNLPLSSRDQELLSILKLKYTELGRSPTMAEVPEASEIKTRFGLWRNALEAASLPSLNSPEQQHLRQNKHLSSPQKNASRD